MSTPEEEFYTEERWANWLDRLREEDIDPEDEDSARLLLNLQDDVAIAVAKIVTAHDEEALDDEAALEELADIRAVVLADPDIADDEAAMLVDGVQTSLMVVFGAAEQYIEEGVADETDVDGYLHAAADAEAEEDFDRALGLVACAGTRLIGHDDAALDVAIAEELEYWLVTEWINGLDSLQEALADPEVVEDEE
ncbi:MAG: DUF2150 family protein [Halobacteriaceae archaeon]